MNKIITILISIIFSSLSINPVKAQEKYSNDDRDKNQIVNVRKQNLVAQKIVEQSPAIYFSTSNCNVVMITKERTEVPCNYLAITVGGNMINYHYGLQDDQDKLYSVSFALPVELPNNVFMIMMDLKEEEPFTFEAQGQCQKQKINNRTDKLTCQAISPDGSKINGEVLVPNFNIEEIIRELQ